MKLIDMVRTHPFHVYPAVQGALDNLGLNVVALANEAVPIEITNVHDWLKSDWYPKATTGGLGTLHEQFSDVRPSFPTMWFEWNKGDGCGRRAVCCVVDEYGDWIIILVDQCPGSLGKTPFISHIGVCELGTMQFGIDPDEGENEKDVRSFLVSSGAVPALMAQTLMHCKNVTVVEAPKEPKREKKFARTHHGVRPTSYRTIVIDPMKAAVRTSSHGAGSEGNAQRMHTIRGHFKTYTSERKLFGKVSGRFFFSAHVAGDSAVGVIKSEYVVKGGGPVVALSNAA